MAMVSALGCSKASPQPVSQRRPHLVPLAAIVTLACCLGGRSYSAFAAIMAQPPVLEKPPMTADDAALARAEDAAHRNLPGFIESNMTTETASWGSPVTRHAGVLQGPPWSTCFVEAEEAGRPILEEWLLRGEASNVNAFRNWRLQSGNSPVRVRCEEAAVRAEDDVLCIECLSRHVAEGAAMRGASITVAVQATFVDLQQCLGSSTGGMGFCKSGKVVIPF
mmetsp:Transcript_38649/g.74179  ORF Transcript_38649/g.74179 Transcript_38649/m.74179 type:complete len:222 (-) Transcript_38649:87-752(-)